jgi:bifunctional non-homologous end joining protein LigD
VTAKLSHPDKLLFPADGITKADLASYYERVAEWMLPHVRDRPLSLQHFPDGIEGHGFFHKNVPKHYPDWVHRVEVAKEGGKVVHADRMVVDLDPPPGTDFAAVRRAARRAGDLLREIGLEPFAQVTGSKGIHVWTPLRRKADFEEVKEFSNAFAKLLAARHPDELTTEFRKAKRAGRILVDVLRNRYAQTAVPPYAVRPRPGAPVATPIEWDELSDSKLRPDRWTLKTVLRRLRAKGDPWVDIGAAAAALSGARKRLEGLQA